MTKRTPKNIRLDAWEIVIIKEAVKAATDKGYCEWSLAKLQTKLDAARAITLHKEPAKKYSPDAIPMAINEKEATS